MSGEIFLALKIKLMTKVVHTKFHFLTHSPAGIMKSTEVQNPRCVLRIRPNNARLLATHRGATVLLPGQYSLLCRLAASCTVWGKAEPAPLFKNPPRCTERTKLHSGGVSHTQSV